MGKLKLKRRTHRPRRSAKPGILAVALGAFMAALLGALLYLVNRWQQSGFSISDGR